MAKKRETITKKLRFEIFKRDSFTCQYCGASAPQVVLNLDHIVPVAKGGTSDILNLVTSCFDCNSGKRDRELSDTSVVTKQKVQLDELNERREQLEMMVQWRSGLHNLHETEIEIADNEWHTLTKTYHLTEHGQESLRKVIKKFGLPCVLDAMSVATQYFMMNSDGIYTQESVDKGFDKVGGICKMSTLPQWEKDLYHIRNTARKQWSYCNDWALLKQMKELYTNNLASIEEIRGAVLSARNWSMGQQHLDCLRDAE